MRGQVLDQNEGAGLLGDAEGSGLPLSVLGGSDQSCT